MTKLTKILQKQFIYTIIRSINTYISNINRVWSTYKKCTGYYKKEDMINTFTYNYSLIEAILTSKKFVEIMKESHVKDYETIYRLMLPMNKFNMELNYNQAFSNLKRITGIIYNCYNENLTEE